MLLLIDNYDSFAHNLARYFTRLGCAVRIVRNDAISVRDIKDMAPEAIVLSPGPCTPDQAGCSIEIVRDLHRVVPILGVCLGHQTIIAALGGPIVRCPPMHGRVSSVHHDEQGIFAGVPNPFQACRYHSLAADRDQLPEPLRVSGETDNGMVMAVRHQDYPVIGLQFHPEAILTQFGYDLLANFLRLAEIQQVASQPRIDDELKNGASPESQTMPRRPITF